MLRRLLRKMTRPDAQGNAAVPTWFESGQAALRDGLQEHCESASDGLGIVAAACLHHASLGAIELVPKDATPHDTDAFARAWLALLIDNDSLPVQQQLSQTDLELPRRLLAAFFFDVGDLQQQASVVLRGIEERFNTGRFGQASLLLQLFDTDGPTRRSNERNLFFEQMSLAILSRRAACPAALRDDYRTAFADSIASPGAGLRPLLDWLADRAGVRLHLRARGVETTAHWVQAVTPLAGTVGADILVHMPHRRWRTPAQLVDQDFALVCREHLQHQSLSDYVARLTRVAYFVTLATGRTGFESFISDYVHWLERHFQTVGTRILPDLHRRWSVDDEALSDALRAVQSTWFDLSRWGSGTFSPEAVAQGVASLHHRFGALDLREVAEGDYDLGGLLYDELVGFSQTGLDRALRVHRLT